WADFGVFTRVVGGLGPCTIIMNCHEPSCATASDSHGSSLSENQKCLSRYSARWRRTIGSGKPSRQSGSERCRRPFAGYTTAQTELGNPNENGPIKRTNDAQAALGKIDWNASSKNFVIVCAFDDRNIVVHLAHQRRH